MLCPSQYRLTSGLRQLFSSVPCIAPKRVTRRWGSLCLTLVPVAAWGTAIRVATSTTTLTTALAAVLAAASSLSLALPLRTLAGRPAFWIDVEPLRDTLGDGAFGCQLAALERGMVSGVAFFSDSISMLAEPDGVGVLADEFFRIRRAH